MPKSVPTLCGLHKRKICLDKLGDAESPTMLPASEGPSSTHIRVCSSSCAHGRLQFPATYYIVRCVKRSSEPSRLSFSFSTLYLFMTMAPIHIAWVYGCLQATWIVRTQADPWVSFTCLSCMASGGSSLIILRSSFMGLER